MNLFVVACRSRMQVMSDEELIATFDQPIPSVPSAETQCDCVKCVESCDKCKTPEPTFECPFKSEGCTKGNFCPNCTIIGPTLDAVDRVPESNLWREAMAAGPNVAKQMNKTGRKKRNREEEETVEDVALQQQIEEEKKRLKHYIKSCQKDAKQQAKEEAISHWVNFQGKKFLDERQIVVDKLDPCGKRRYMEIMGIRNRDMGYLSD